MKFKESIFINKPIEQVFKLWVAVERYPDWVVPVIERKKLTEGPMRIGTKFHAIDKWPGRKAEFDMEITELEQNKRLCARWFKPMEGNWTSQLTETNEGTKLDFEIEMNLPPLMNFFSPLLLGWAKKQNQKFMESFKHFVENQ